MNSKIYLGLAIVALLLVSNAFVGYKAYNFGKNSIQVKWDKETLDRTIETQKKNDAIIKQKPKVKHENQNRDRVALVRHICARGWVLKPEQCDAYR